MALTSPDCGSAGVAALDTRVLSEATTSAEAGAADRQAALQAEYETKLRANKGNKKRRTEALAAFVDAAASGKLVFKVSSCLI